MASSRPDRPTDVDENRVEKFFDHLVRANTTMAALLASVLLHLDPTETIGVGVGDDAAMLRRKLTVVNSAVERIRCDHPDTLGRSAQDAGCPRRLLSSWFSPEWCSTSRAEVVPSSTGSLPRSPRCARCASKRGLPPAPHRRTAKPRARPTVGPRGARNRGTARPSATRRRRRRCSARRSF